MLIFSVKFPKTTGHSNKLNQKLQELFILILLANEPCCVHDHNHNKYTDSCKMNMPIIKYHKYSCALLYLATKVLICLRDKFLTIYKNV